MSADLVAIQAVLATIVTAATPLLLAALGELVAERSGVLNLGVEGMMVMGAVAGFAVALTSGSPELGIVAAALAGMALAVPFGLLTLVFAANQVATGLALTLLGLGLSGLVGEHFVGQPGVRLPRVHLPLLSDIPFVGPILFGQDILVYLSFVLALVVARVLFHSRFGLVLRAVGDNHTSAHALGYSVIGVRWTAVLFGGALAGLGGGYLSLAYTPQWIENMTAGRGWIALALVVFASWLPGRLVAGAYLFGAVTILGFYVQGMGLGIPAQFLSSLPYLVTVAALVVISRRRGAARADTPACLGQSFVPDR
jgi:simple sugar transport system permease protein